MCILLGITAQITYPKHTLIKHISRSRLEVLLDRPVFLPVISRRSTVACEALSVLVTARAIPKILQQVARQDVDPC
jgi:hypothetical protein